MSAKYNIDTISKMIGIPKSTLRYWESEGLVHLKRNHENNYREYSLSNMFEIMDVMSYRILNMPMKEIKELGEKSAEHINQLLVEKEKQIEAQIRQLEEIKEAIEHRQNHYKIYQHLISHPYEEASCDFDLVYLFDYRNTEHWRVCQKDNAYLTLSLSNDGKKFVTGIIPDSRLEQMTDRNKQKILWQKEKTSGKFLRCILKASFENPEDNNMEHHMKALRAKGIRTGSVMAQLLFTAYDEGKYDYYLAWIEVID